MRDAVSQMGEVDVTNPPVQAQANLQALRSKCLVLGYVVDASTTIRQMWVEFSDAKHRLAVQDFLGQISRIAVYLTTGNPRQSHSTQRAEHDAPTPRQQPHTSSSSSDGRLGCCFGDVPGVVCAVSGYLEHHKLKLPSSTQVVAAIRERAEEAAKAVAKKKSPVKRQPTAVKAQSTVADGSYRPIVPQAQRPGSATPQTHSRCPPSQRRSSNTDLLYIVWLCCARIRSGSKRAAEIEKASAVSAASGGRAVSSRELNGEASKYPPLYLVSSRPGGQTMARPSTTYSSRSSWVGSETAEGRYERTRREREEGGPLRALLDSSQRRIHSSAHGPRTASSMDKAADVANDDLDFEPPTARPMTTLTANKQTSLPFRPTSSNNSSSSYSSYGSSFDSYNSHLPSSSSYRFSSSSTPSDSTRFSGMRNVGGNSCYMNAILQSLFAQPSFTSSLLQPLPLPLPAHSLYASLVALVRLHGEEDHGVIDPEPLKSAIGSRLKRYAGNRQQDAHEFLMEALNALTEDIVDSREKQWRAESDLTQPPSHTQANGVDPASSRATDAIDADGDQPMAGAPSSVESVLGDDVTIISDESGKENHSPRRSSAKSHPLAARPLSPPPAELLRQWQAEACDVSAAQQNFHCEVEVTLSCTNSSCAHTRSNIEHFSALSLDLPEEEQGQQKIDDFFATPKSSNSYSLNSFSTSASTSSAPNSSLFSNPSSSSSAASPNSSLPDYLRSDADKARASVNASASSFGFSSALSLSSSSSSSPAVGGPRRSLPSLESLLQQFFSPSVLEYRCERCGHSHVRITSKLTRLPRVLILHIKRFTPDPVTGKNQKRADPVSVQRSIDLTPLCTDHAERPTVPPSTLPPPSLEKATDTAKLAVGHNGLNGSSLHVHPPPTPRNQHATLSQSSSADASAAAASSRAPPVTPPSGQPSGRRSISPASVQAASTPSSSSVKRARPDSASVFDYTGELTSPSSGDRDGSAGSKRPRRAAAALSPFAEKPKSLLWSQKANLNLERSHKVNELVQRWQAKKAAAAGASATTRSDLDEEHVMALSLLDADIGEKMAELVAREEAYEEQRAEKEQQKWAEEEEGDVSEPGAALDDEQDEELQKVLELSKTDQRQRRAPAAEEEDAELQRAIRLSMADQPPPMVDEVEDDAELSTLSATSAASGRASPLRQPATPMSVATTLSPASEASVPPAHHSPVPVPSAPSTPPPSLPSSQPFPVRYSLNGVVLHKGVFSTSGHYVADLLVKEKRGERGEVWQRYDDQYVTTLIDDHRLKKTWETEGYIFFFTLQP